LRDSVFEAYGVERVEDLKTLYSRNKVVSIHAPKIPETHHSVNAEILAAMPDGASVINTSRGSVIETGALVEELKTGRISASLDVFEEEPLPADSSLRGLPNCHLTCHTAGPTPDRIAHLGQAAIDNVKRYIDGEDALYRVSTEQYDLMT
jgi:phosphoglycerate dehydrogenase-like enzyme